METDPLQLGHLEIPGPNEPAGFDDHPCDASAESGRKMKSTVVIDPLFIYSSSKSL